MLRCLINCTELFTSYFSSTETETTSNHPVHKSKEKGVSVEYLKTIFAEEVRGYGNNITLQKTIYDLEDTRQEENGFIRSKGKDVICPRDGKLGAAFVDCLHGEDNVGIANVMLSYCWGNTVDEIIDVLHHFVLKKDLDPKKTYVWICCLCNNQHRVFERSKKKEVVPFKEFQAIFEGQVKGVDSIVALMSPWQNSLYLTRVWCIFELHTAHVNGCNIHIEMPHKEREELKRTVLTSPEAFEGIFNALASTKIGEAKASVESDRTNILGIVEAGSGTASLNIVVNDRLRKWIFASLKDFVKEDLDDYVKKESYGGKHPSDLDDGYNNIGLIFFRNDQFEEAMDCVKKQCELCEGWVGKTHEYTARAYNSMAMMHLGLTEYDDAIEWSKKAIPIYEKVYGLKHEQTATLYLNIGGIYLRKEDWDEALKYSKKSREIRERTYGKDHVQTAAVYNDIGYIHIMKGDYDMALHYLENCLEIRKKTYPDEDNPDIATTYNNIGVIHEKKGDIDKELKYYLLALGIYEKVLGVDHSLTLNSYTNISSAYEKKGDNENTMKYNRKANQEV
jgi:tetratricopeptide (TPR) repeat protein